MNAREHMEKHLRKLQGGTLAWDRGLFTKAAALRSVELIDAAVDIAWDRLMPANALERPTLEILGRGDMLVFRLNLQPLA